jgi:hypothetical protein
MNKFIGNPPWRVLALSSTLSTVLSAVLSATCVCLISIVNAQAQSIEGVWRLSAPLSTPLALLRPVDGKAIPFTAKGRRQHDANLRAANNGDYSFDLSKTRCASPGQPRLMLTSRPFAIFVRPRMVTILYEWNRLFRQISIGEPLINPVIGEDWWQFGVMQGRSRAKWKGDVLEIRTVGFAEKLLDDVTPSSDKLELMERMRLRDANLLEDRITITDTEMFMRPWDVVLTYTRQPDELFPFKEHVCLDGLKLEGRVEER